MPLPITNAYRLRLSCLRAKSPPCAELAQALSAALCPQVLTISSALLTDDLFGHLDAVSRPCPDSVVRLGVWLHSLVVLKALRLEDAQAFIIAARAIVDPTAPVRPLTP